MINKKLKLSERMQDTQNRRCDNNDIDYGYNMAIDDWLPEVQKLEKEKQELINKYEELLLEEAMYLYQYYHQSYNISTEEYFRNELEFLEKLTCKSWEELQDDK